MPIKSGIEVVHDVRGYIAELNKDKQLVEEPVFIFLSAHVSDPNFQTVWRRLGVQHFYEKPLSDTAARELQEILEAS